MTRAAAPFRPNYKHLWQIRLRRVLARLLCGLPRCHNGTNGLRGGISIVYHVHCFGQKIYIECLHLFPDSRLTRI